MLLLVLILPRHESWGHHFATAKRGRKQKLGPECTLQGLAYSENWVSWWVTACWGSAAEKGSGSFKYSQVTTGELAGKRRPIAQGAGGETMKKLSKAILERDAKRDIGQEVLQAIREIKAGGGRRFTVQVTEATEARLKLGLSQADFAAMLGVSARTLQDWEQGRREPSGAAKALLKVAVAAPKTVRKVLAAA